MMGTALRRFRQRPGLGIGQPVVISHDEADGGVEIVVGKSGVQDFMAVGLEVGRCEPAWGRLPAVEKEDEHAYATPVDCDKVICQPDLYNAAPKAVPNLPRTMIAYLSAEPQGKPAKSCSVHGGWQQCPTPS